MVRPLFQNKGGHSVVQKCHDSSCKEVMIPAIRRSYHVDKKGHDFRNVEVMTMNNEQL
jgi:hypothetical protein